MMESKTDEHTGLLNVEYKKTKLSGKTIQFTIPKYEEIYLPTMKHHPFYTYHDKSFSAERLMYSTIPLHIGSYDIKYEPKSVVNVLRCPIKNTGNRDIIIPSELEYLKEYITFCCIYETSFNNRFEDLFAHITVDYNDCIKAGTTHRVPGWHVDGYQGNKFPEKTEIEHSYLWSASETKKNKPYNCGTEFCVQPFFISHIDESKYLIFDEFNKQAKESNIIKTIDSNVYIFDPYMVHRSPIPNVDISRLLVRITMEYTKLLDPNDTQNGGLMFKTPYKYDIRNRLCEFKIPLNLETYGYKY
jgi:hypothetical protein